MHSFLGRTRFQHLTGKVLCYFVSLIKAIHSNVRNSTAEKKCILWGLKIGLKVYYAPNFEKVGDILVSACPCVCVCVFMFEISS